MNPRAYRISIRGLRAVALACWLPPVLAAAPPPVPVTTILEPKAEQFGLSLAVSSDTLAATTTSPNGSITGAVFIYDKAAAPGWGLRTTISAPVGPAQGFGSGVAHNGGDLLAVSTWEETRIHQRNFGGTDAWGLLATVPKYASAVSLQGMAFSGDRLVVVQRDSTGTHRVAVHDRDHPTAGAWSPRATLTNPLPPYGVVPFAGSLALEADLLIVSGLESGRVGVVLHAYRKDQDGTNLWGQVGTLRPSDLSGVTSIGGSLALSGGRLICSVRRTAWPASHSVLVVRPPAARGGAWTLENTVTPTASLLVGDSFATAIRRGGNDSFAVNVQRTHALIPGGVQRRVAVYRGTGAGLVLEQETDAGPVEMMASGSRPRIEFNLAAADGVFAVRTRHPSADPEQAAARPAVSVHERGTGGTNAWGRTAAILSPAADPGRFGQSVAISGLLMAVGDPEDALGGSATGAVSLYRRSQVLENDWNLTAIIRMSPPVAGARFGTKVDVAENGIIAATAPGLDQVLVMRETGIFATLGRPSGINASDAFAQSVAITPSGADILVGAPSAFAGGSTTVRAGAVVHFRAANPADPGSYTHRATLRGANPAFAESSLGWCVDALEDTVAAGAWTAKDLSGETRGAALVWSRTGPAVDFTVQSAVYPADTSRGLFGHDVALGYSRGQPRLLIGTTPPLFGSNSGGAFLFHRPASGLWSAFATLLPAANQSGYGLSVALNDGVAVVGSPFGLNGSTAGGVELFWSDGGLDFSARRAVVPSAWGVSGEGCGTAVAFDGCGLAAAAPLGDRVHTWRFGGYERWLGKSNVPDASQSDQADPDRDMRINLLEYAGGGDPVHSSVFDGFRFLNQVDGDITAIWWDSSNRLTGEVYFDDIRVAVEQSNDAISWRPAPLTVPRSAPVAAGYYHRNPPPGQPPGMFYRFRVEYPVFR